MIQRPKSTSLKNSSRMWNYKVILQDNLEAGEKGTQKQEQIHTGMDEQCFFSPFGQVTDH